MAEQFYITSLEHLLAELERIELLIAGQVACVRRQYARDEHFRGLYISEDEIDILLAQPIGMPRWTLEQQLLEQNVKLQFLSQQIRSRKEESLCHNIELRLVNLQNLFALDQFEIDILLVCFAAELDLRYEKFYAYLQDDVTKKRPSVDLILNLLSRSYEEKLHARRYFATDAQLIRHQLVTLFEDSSQQPPPLIGRYLKVEERVVDYLLDSDRIDGKLAVFVKKVAPVFSFDELVFSDSFKRQLRQCLSSAEKERSPVFFFQGLYGIGRNVTAQAYCRENGMNLVLVDVERLFSSKENDIARIIGSVIREGILQNAPLYWSGFDVLFGEDHQEQLQTCLKEIDQYPFTTFIASETLWEPKNSDLTKPFLRFDFPMPDYDDRIGFWQKCLNDNKAQTSLDVKAIVSCFNLTGGQIRDCFVTAQNLALRKDYQNPQITTADLFEACRLQSNRNLAFLAQNIEPHYHWQDIVLPEDQLCQLREILNTLKYRATVYGDWGFGKKLALGKGINILFAGPSGTGKTMAAEIIADEMGLELYKIDLSMVVSKYIGETEKNLSRIFTEAQTANAILFFDEADALFGKRSEVRDAHDRYANIEVGYLLQKMEEYDGVVILATNFRKNLDDAFVRRIHFSVEFPFPNEQDRLRIWQGVFPDKTPMGLSVNLRIIAKKFEITGGNIRNIALASAFLAADDSCMVEMEHLLRATQREYQKIGRLVMDEDFQNLTPSEAEN